MGGFGRDPIPGFHGVPSSARPQPATEPEKVRLRVLNGPCARRIFTACGSHIRIGRGDLPTATVDVDLGECELGSPAMVSRLHAELLWIEGQLHLVDLGSRNGTWIDDAPIRVGDRQASNPVPVRIGSKIRFANLELEIVGPEAEDA